MNLPKPEVLEHLTRDELLALILQFVDMVLQQQRANERLEAENAELRKRLGDTGGPPKQSDPSAPSGPPPPSSPATSRNSSQPPSRDEKANARLNRPRRPRGAKQGHAKMERPWSDDPKQVMKIPVTCCSQCGQDLSQLKPTNTIRRQVTELPPVQPIVIETQQDQVKCPCCGYLECGALPAGLEADRCFGAHLEAILIYFQHQQHMSYKRTQQTMRDVFGLDISQGGQASILERAGAAAQVQADEIAEQVRHSAVINSDETSARVDGYNWWEWVFVSTTGVVHLIEPTRSQTVIDDFMGDARAEVWGSDCWPAQLNAPAETFQICLAHQVRNLERAIDEGPDPTWARQVQALFREAIHLRKRHDDLTPEGYARRVSELEHRLERLIDPAVTVEGERANRLLARYRKHRDHLLVFLRDLRVAYDNNVSERALRPSVIHRKVIGGFRSAWGARGYAAIATVVDTAKLMGQGILDAIEKLMGKSAYHYASTAGP